VFIIGAGSHAKAIFEAVRTAEQLNVIGLVDPAPPRQSN
jgi:FlaA1/EpsC-like NDP-sugar epimerase